VVEASFRCTELREMGWLGGGGYKYLGLWIHGVQYTRKDESKVHGSLLVVLLESLADPIITGREELGMPKLFCDIDITKATEKEDSARIECSWRGQTFLRMSMDGLAEESDNNGQLQTNGNGTEAPSHGPPGPPKPKEEGTIFYRYVPAVGKPGEADAAYAVLIRDGSVSSTPRAEEKTWRSRESQLEFMEGDSKSLPTLHNVAAGFADIPVYGVIEAKVEDRVGVDDLRNAERIE
jgi:hypothetical protein